MAVQKRMQEFVCDYCRAAKGRRCVDWNGKPQRAAHAARFQQAVREGRLPVVSETGEQDG